VTIRRGSAHPRRLLGVPAPQSVCRDAESCAGASVDRDAADRVDLRIVVDPRRSKFAPGPARADRSRPVRANRSCSARCRCTRGPRARAHRADGAGQAVVEAVFRSRGAAELGARARRARPHRRRTRADRAARASEGRAQPGMGAGQALPIASLAELFAGRIESRAARLAVAAAHRAHAELLDRWAGLRADARARRGAKWRASARSRPSSRRPAPAATRDREQAAAISIGCSRCARSTRRSSRQASSSRCSRCAATAHVDRIGREGGAALARLAGRSRPARRRGAGNQIAESPARLTALGSLDPELRPFAEAGLHARARRGARSRRGSGAAPRRARADPGRLREWKRRHRIETLRPSTGATVEDVLATATPRRGT